MEEVLGFVVPGIVLGLAAGLAPGPLLVLVVAHSVRHGTREGVKVAIAPLITDLPIIGLAILGFLGSMYSCLIGSKMLLAVAAGRSGEVFDQSSLRVHDPGARGRPCTARAVAAA